jgi:hypothetical protein
MPRRIDEDIERHELETAAMEAQILAEAGGLPSEDGSSPSAMDPVSMTEPRPVPDPVVEVVSTEPVPDPVPVVVPVSEPVLPPQQGVLSRLGRGNATKPEVVSVEEHQRLAHKYESEVPNLHKRVAERDEQLAQIRQELEVERRRRAELEDRVGSLTREELMDRYGLDEDGLDLLGGADSTNRFRSVSGRVAEERLSPLREELRAVRNELDGFRSEQAQRRITQFETQTKRDHPELDAPEFMDWLDQNPSRIDRFSAAFGAGDVESLLGEHTLFQALRGNLPVAPTSLEAQAMPGQSATPSALGVSKPKQYTIGDVARLNQKFDHEAGGMTPEARATLSAEINAAEAFVAQSYEYRG